MTNKILFKMKKFIVEYHYYVPVIIVILLITGIVCVCLSPFVYQYITHEGDIDRDYTYIYNDIIYDETNRLTLENPIIFNSQDQIYCSVKSETGGDTVDVWIEIIWLF